MNATSNRPCWKLVVEISVRDEVHRNRVGKIELTNKINCTNFQDASVWINFKHPQYDQIIT